ncbi:MAG: hypothetical protein WCA37_00550 [Terracidiphilus sp.]
MTWRNCGRVLGIPLTLHGLGLSVALGLSLAAQSASAQQGRHDPLTPQQVDQIREAGIDPNNRILLYTKFVNEHVDTVRDLLKEGLSTSRAQKMDDELQMVTALADELGSNLDQYGARKADLRRALKKLNEDAPKWMDAIRALPAHPAFDLSRKEALESGQDLRDEAAEMLTEQTAYFKEHKEEKGQERAEPQN